MGPDHPAHAAVARVARESCRRLIALLASRSGGIAQAEDALADAFRSALETWPNQGIPRNPEAWLLTAARRRVIDAHRHDAVRAEAVTTLLSIADEAMDGVEEGAAFPDERLKLLFVCAHPAIDVAARTPLMLQVVLGLDAGDIASAFLVKPATMAQRLARAKAKIRDARISYEVPDHKALPERLDAVLQAIYGIYGLGWDELMGADSPRRGHAAEAVELGRLLHLQMPDQAEVKGLLALMLHCEARRPARRNASGEFVPLDEQDTSLWLHPLIAEADELLAQASLLNTLGRFQLEAAIQSVHARRSAGYATDWQSIALLYDGLASRAPALGTWVARASAWSKVQGPDFALQLLAQLPTEAVEGYQPYWVLLSTLMQRLGRLKEASTALERAIGLCVDPATRQYLLQQAMFISVSMRGHA